MRRRAGLVALTLLTLGGCGGGGAGSAPEDAQAASLEAQVTAQIVGWRGDLMKTTPACADAPADKACSAFEVACKGQLAVSPADAAKGVTDEVVVAMTYNAWNRAQEEFRPASAFARFTKADGRWTRQETAPVNLSTCAAA
jgi:hypothetical protein